MAKSNVLKQTHAWPFHGSSFLKTAAYRVTMNETMRNFNTVQAVTKAITSKGSGQMEMLSKDLKSLPQTLQGRCSHGPNRSHNADPCLVLLRLSVPPQSILLQPWVWNESSHAWTATWLETTSDSVWTMIKDFTEMVKYLRVLLLLHNS